MSMVRFAATLDMEAKLYLESMYDTYVELHPTLRKGEYLSMVGGPIESGVFFVDLSGILREGGKNSLRAA